jgi:hypothetical protein
VAALGVAGEPALALTIYLVGVSRLLARPLAAIVQGPSSSGKSYAIEKVASLFPREAVVHATQMTPQALFHMEPGSLAHRFVVAGERSRAENDERAEATRALREMLAGGRLVKLMPIKANGEIITRPIEQDGPIAFVESTTLTDIFEEDLNPCVLLQTDERSNQTRKVITTLATRYSGNELSTTACVERHHALQRMLQPLNVVIPFADRLGNLFTDQRVEARRAFPQLMSFVQASALLHQRQRDLDVDRRLVAVADDYQLAAHLLAKPFARQLGGRLSDAADRFLARLRAWAGTSAFTPRQAVQEEKSSRASVYGWIDELHNVGYVEAVTVSKGPVPATWRLVDRDDHNHPAGILPTVQELFTESAGRLDTSAKPAPPKQ